MPSDKDVGQIIQQAFDNIKSAHQVLDVGSLINSPYDYVLRTLSSPTIETWEFRSGGSGGTLELTITIRYTDATLNTIFDVSRT